MADLHIEDFYRDVAGILLALYRNFPQPSIIFVEDLVGPQEPDAFGVPSPRHQACYSAMLWLAEEGFLRYADVIGQDGLDQCRLTERAFVTLARPSRELMDADLPPSIARQRATLAQQLREVLTGGSSTELADTVQRCFQRSGSAV